MATGLTGPLIGLLDHAEPALRQCAEDAARALLVAAGESPSEPLSGNAQLRKLVLQAAARALLSQSALLSPAKLPKLPKLRRPPPQHSRRGGQRTYPMPRHRAERR